MRRQGGGGKEHEGQLPARLDDWLRHRSSLRVPTPLTAANKGCVGGASGEGRRGGMLVRQPSTAGSPLVQQFTSDVLLLASISMAGWSGAAFRTA